MPDASEIAVRMMPTDESRITYDGLNISILRQFPIGVRRVLDLGCGTGALGAALKQRAALEVVGVTFSQDEAKEARKRLNKVVVADLEEFGDGLELGRFDAVVCSHVLEHLRQPQQLLRQLHNCLSPRGILFIALPNVLYWKQRLPFLFGRFRYTAGGLMDSTHYRFYDWQSATQLVESAGYEIIKRTADGSFPQPYLRKVIPSLSEWIDAAACHFFPGLFGHQFVILARRQTVSE